MSDATEGYSGGYHYETRGMSKIVSIFSFQFNLDNFGVLFLFLVLIIIELK